MCSKFSKVSSNNFTLANDLGVIFTSNGCGFINPPGRNPVAWSILIGIGSPFSSLACSMFNAHTIVDNSKRSVASARC